MNRITTISEIKKVKCGLWLINDRVYENNLTLSVSQLARSPLGEQNKR